VFTFHRPTVIEWGAGVSPTLAERVELRFEFLFAQPRDDFPAREPSCKCSMDHARDRAIADAYARGHLPVASPKLPFLSQYLSRLTHQQPLACHLASLEKEALAAGLSSVTSLPLSSSLREYSIVHDGRSKRSRSPI
jgi:hypothetical protein